MVLNRNPDNFSLKTNRRHFIRGILFPAFLLYQDPQVLQARSYTDTRQPSGGPNFHEIPINRPTCPYHNFQCDGMHRMDIDTNPANYERTPLMTTGQVKRRQRQNAAASESYQNAWMAIKSAKRSPSFGEYYAHPRLFWLSQTPIELQHIIDAFSF